MHWVAQKFPSLCKVFNDLCVVELDAFFAGTACGFYRLVG